MKPVLPLEARVAVKRGVALRTVAVPDARALHLALLFRAGAEGDPPQGAGATHLAAKMLFEGTLRRDTLGLAAAMEGMGLHYSAEVRHEAAILRFALPRENFPRAMRLIEELVFASAFRNADFERLREQAAAVLEKELKDPGAVAANALNGLLLRGTPQAHPPKGTPESIRGAALDGVKRRRDALLGTGVEAVLCGRAGRRDLEAMERFLKRFPAARPASAPLSALTPAPPGVYFRPWPGAVQSELRLGAPGPVPGGRDWYPTLLLNTLLGGKFTSRLNLNLRETHGFTYGVRSYLQDRRAFSCFCVSAAVATGVTGPALRELFRELDGMATPAFDPKELADAAGYLSGSFHYALDNPGLYLNRIVEREVLGLPAGHFGRYLRFLARAPRLDHAGVPRAPFDRSRAVLVVVGDPAVRAQLRSLRLPVREA